MTNTIYIHQPEKAVSFTRLPNFLFEAPTFTPLSNEAKVLYAFILRRTDLSRKNGWADEYGRIYLYYPINEVVELLLCGRQKAVNTLRELQYAGLVEIQKQGCEAPTFTPLSNEAKVLYAFILRRTDLSRKNGWADEYGRIYLYYPINEVVELLLCGRQKAVNTLRELQYAGLVEIQKQGCGKPNRIYPKSYEAVPNTDFKKSGYGTPED